MPNPQHPPFLLAVNKPVGMTSTQVVSYFRGRLPKGTKKVGHMGTLDPFASGLLIIAGNGAARLNSFAQLDGPKQYLAVGKLGIKTDSGDRMGAIVERRPKESREWNLNELDSLVKRKFVGEYMQVPPHFSAVKINGRPSYQYARQGTFITKEAVKREIIQIEILHIKWPYLSLRVTASSGTYIRTLFEDIAGLMGTTGHLISLVREKVGNVDRSLAMTRAYWPKKTIGNVKEFGRFLINPNRLINFPSLQLNSSLDAKFFGQGRCLTEYQGLNSSSYFVHFDGHLLGVGQVSSELIHPKIVF